MGYSALHRVTQVGAPQSVGRRLDAASRAIDAHFLDLGRALAQAVEGLGKLVASLDAMREAVGGELVAETTAELQAAAQDLLALPAYHADRSGTIERLADAAERLAAGIVDMRRDLAYLRVFAINIKITAGGIATAGREFSDFAQEIGDGIERGRAHLDAFDADLATLREGFRVAVSHDQVRAEQCAGLFPAVPDGLIASAKAMVEHHLRIGKVAGEVAALVRAVQKKVGSALAALQIGDITRQRIEHASEALELLGGVDGLSAGQQERMAIVVHALLTAQLHAAAEDFHSDVARISAAMGGIAGDAVEMLRLRDLAFGQAKDDGDGFLRQLEKHVDQAMTVVRDMAEADRRALAMGAEVSAASVDLSGQITELRAIKADVQHMAMNTTLKCGRIGDAGKPLAVIAVELRLHAGHMDTSALQAMSSLDDLSRDARHMSQADSGQAAGFSEAVGARLSDVARTLKEAGDKVEADLASVAREGDAVVEGLRHASASMDFQREIGAIVDEVAQALAEHAGDQASITADIAAPLSELLAKIAKRYTMAQEREVHRSMTESLSGEADDVGPEAVSDELEMEDVLF